MNLDNLKSLWNKEDVSETPEISPEKQRQIHHPLERIRKNMRYEFWINNICLLFLIPLTDFSRLGPVIFTMYIVLLFIVGYYTFKFYKFYKSIKAQNFETFNHLLELKYNMKLFTELYKSYYVSSVPFFLSILMLFLQKTDFSNYPDTIYYLPFIIFFSIVAIILLIGVIWFNSYYGKHIVTIEKLVEEMKQN